MIHFQRTLLLEQPAGSVWAQISDLRTCTARLPESASCAANQDHLSAIVASRLGLVPLSATVNVDMVERAAPMRARLNGRANLTSWLRRPGSETPFAAFWIEACVEELHGGTSRVFFDVQLQAARGFGTLCEKLIHIKMPSIERRLVAWLASPCERVAA